MNGIERITRRIAAEAETEAAAVLAEAEKAAAGVRDNFAAQAEESFRERLRQGTEELDNRVQRAERAARLEARKEVLALKQEMVGAAYDLARERILALPEAEYAAFLARLAAAAAVTGREELLFSAADRSRLGQKVVDAANALLKERGLPGALRLAGDSRTMAGGVVLREGKIEINCGLESLLEQSRSAMDAEVAKVLFR